MRKSAVAFCLFILPFCFSSSAALGAEPVSEDLRALKDRAMEGGCGEATLNPYAEAAHAGIMALVQRGALDEAGEAIGDLFTVHEACPEAKLPAYAFISVDAMIIAALVQGPEPELARPYLDMQRRAVAAYPDRDHLGLFGRNLRQFGEEAGDEVVLAELYALEASHPDNDLLAAETAEAWCGKYGTALRNAGIEEAAPLYRKIIAEYERFPDNLTIRNAVARAMFQTVVACKRNEWLAEAESWCKRLADFAAKHRDPKIVQVLYGHAVKTLMEAASDKGGKEGLAVMERSLPALETLAREHPNTRSFDVFLGQGLGMIIAAYVGENAMDMAREKLIPLEKAAARQPKDAVIREELDKALTVIPD